MVNIAKYVHFVFPFSSCKFCNASTRFVYNSNTRVMFVYIAYNLVPLLFFFIPPPLMVNKDFHTTDLNDAWSQIAGHDRQKSGVGEFEIVALVGEEVTESGWREPIDVVDPISLYSLTTQSYHRAARQAVHVRESVSAVQNSAIWKKKKKNKFIKPQYNNSINTQHCGRLSEKTNVHHAGHLKTWMQQCAA